MVYVPLLKSVEILLKDEGIYAEVSMHVVKCNSEIYLCVGKKGSFFMYTWGGG